MPDANSLAGKTAIITGASAGIGWATALAFAEKGARVVVTARREQRLRELCDLIGARDGKAVYLAGDGADEATAQNCVALAVKQFGRLDILINNAGAGNYKNLVDTSVEEYDALMDSNMKSSFLFTRHAAPVMIAQKGGEILFISSVAGLQGYAGEAVYCASKLPRSASRRRWTVSCASMASRWERSAQAASKRSLPWATGGPKRASRTPT